MVTGRAEEADTRAPWWVCGELHPTAEAFEPKKLRVSFLVPGGDLPIPIGATVDRWLLRHAHTCRGARQLGRSTIQMSDNVQATQGPAPGHGVEPHLHHRATRQAQSANCRQAVRAAHAAP